MSERLKFILFIVFSLIVSWFTLILLCLPQGEPWPPATPASVIVEDSPVETHRHHARRSSPSKSRRSEPAAARRGPPKSPDIMQLFQARPLTLLETIFYQFDPVQDVTNLTRSANSLIVSASKHKEATLKLGSLNGPTDHYVKLKGDSLFSFNLVASNRVGLLRPLPDTRQAKCPRSPIATGTTSYTCSIVICYYNEAPSALLRTIYSILARTELHLLKEIILVDDFSEPGYDMDQVLPYLKLQINRLAEGGASLVRYVRTPKREGLIRARLFGAAMAQGQVLIFLDSHVEPNVGWLEPLLSAIQANHTTIACPMIDLINAETMLYTASPMVKGGLTWALHFKWASVPANTLKTYDDFIRPIRSPTMAGGLYAIYRDYFYHLGAYDPGMNLWGGENIELSLKAWMCGGQILILPCSRVGHIFRKTRPYGPAPDEPDSLTYNSHRVARVWLGDDDDDNYLEHYYEQVPQARTLDSGDISERLELRRNLKCQNFTWFLENIDPDMMREQLGTKHESEGGQKRPGILPNSKRINRSVREGLHIMPPPPPATLNENLAGSRSLRHNDSLSKLASKRRQHYASLDVNEQPNHESQVISMFQIQLIDSNLCLEPKLSLMKQLKFSRLVLEECSNLTTTTTTTTTTTNQLWSETESHEIRLARHGGGGGGYCLDIMKNLPLIRLCHNMGSYQAWTHSSSLSSSSSSTTNQTSTGGTHIMSYFSSGSLCLAVERVQRGEPVIVTICDKNDPDDTSSSSTRRRRRRRSGRHKSPGFGEKISVQSNRDSGGGSWLTGPLPFAQTINQRRRLGPVALVVHQKWKLNIISKTGRDI